MLSSDEDCGDPESTTDSLVPNLGVNVVASCDQTLLFPHVKATVSGERIGALSGGNLVSALQLVDKGLGLVQKTWSSEDFSRIY